MKKKLGRKMEFYVNFTGGMQDDNSLVVSSICSDCSRMYHTQARSGA